MRRISCAIINMHSLKESSCRDYAESSRNDWKKTLKKFFTERKEDDVKRIYMFQKRFDCNGIAIIYGFLTHNHNQEGGTIIVIMQRIKLTLNLLSSPT